MRASSQFERGHLRLAPPVQRPPPRTRRVSLHLQALAGVLGLAWRSVAGVLAAAIALVPLLWRGAPLGRRLRSAEPREARIISFQARRRALPH